MAVYRRDNGVTTVVLDVAQYMSPIGRFTHVFAYLWLVKNAPGLWRRIDSYQKRQPHTSPEWFYRRECRRLMELIKRLDPGAIVATEVGCCEIGAMIKRDLRLDIPLAAVNVDYEVDRAWFRPEVDLYTVCRPSMRESLEDLGAAKNRIQVWGVPIEDGFDAPQNKALDRRHVDELLKLKPGTPLVILAGGNDGIGHIKETIRTLADGNIDASIVVLVGRNVRLKRECEALTRNLPNFRVLGWTDQMPLLFRAADVLISKLGVSFDEACACGLPIISMPPPPGAEEVKFDLMQSLGIGQGVSTPLEAVVAVDVLLNNKTLRSQMGENALSNSMPDAATKIAAWLTQNAK